MAAHAQQQLLEKVRDALVAAAIVPAGRVHLDRTDPFDAERQLPALNVLESPDGEQVDLGNAGAGLRERTFSIVVQCVVAQTAGYAAAARELGRLVELALYPAAVPSPKRCRLASSRIVLDTTGEIAVAMRELTWRITYFAKPDEPDSPR